MKEATKYPHSNNFLKITKLYPSTPTNANGKTMKRGSPNPRSKITQILNEGGCDFEGLVEKIKGP